MKLELECVRCGKYFLREKAKENHRVKRGRSGPYCSELCAKRRYDDPRLSREPDPVPGAKWLRLTRGKFALVDEDVFAELSLRQWRWQEGGKSAGHAASGTRRTFVFLHHAVLGLESKVVVDHRDNNGLDCRRENLRIASRYENGANREKFVGHEGRKFTSRYKGVVDRSKHLTRTHVRSIKIKSIDHPWLARIRVDGKLINLGLYASEREAALAYDAAAIEHFGEFAKTNFSVEAKAS